MVIGFSQGSVFATILISLGVLNVKYVVLMLGSQIQDVNYRPVKKIGIRCINIIGEKDELVNAGDSMELANYYESSETIMHKYGHCIPTNAEVRIKLEGFIKI